ncbi:MAG: aminotransferase class III-fold pyridoxal phosphate-dependent enzyme [Candidatus Bathyarchaeia archaeon]
MKRVFSKISAVPPGPKAREVIRREVSLLVRGGLRPYTLVPSGGEGSVLTDVDGNSYIDFTSGGGLLSLGHNHPRIIGALKAKIGSSTHIPPSHCSEEMLTLADTLSKITPGGYKKSIYLDGGGSTPLEVALKLLRWHTRKHYFIGFIGAFHGETYGALTLTADKPVRRRYLGPFLPNVYQAPYPYCFRCPLKLEPSNCSYSCVDFLEDCVFKRFLPPEDVAAVVAEPILGEGGCVIPPSEYFIRLKKLLECYGIPLLVDEGECGIGRTGRWFAIECWAVEPDLTCFGGDLAGGLSLGGFAVRADMADWDVEINAGGLGLNPLTLAAAIATIDTIKDEGLLDNATNQGRYLLRRLEEFRGEHPLIGDVRGKGLMVGVELVREGKGKRAAEEEAKEVITTCWKRGLCLTLAGASTLRINPPLTVTREIIDEGLSILEGVLKEVRRES